MKNLILHLEESLNLKIYENQYIKNIDKNFTDICAIGINGDKKIIGRGISNNANIALKKAVYELIERVLLQELSIDSTNGLAVGDTFEIAYQNAKMELIEREIILRHWNLKINFDDYNDSYTEILSKKFHAVYDKNIKIKFHKSKIRYRGQSVIICKITGLYYSQTFGSYYGFGLKNDLHTSVSHSFFESINQFSHDFANNELSKNISLSEFMSKNTHKFSDHGLLCKNTDFTSKVDEIYFKEHGDHIPYSDISDDLNFITQEFEFLKQHGIYCIKLINNTLYKLKTGIDNSYEFPHIID